MQSRLKLAVAIGLSLVFWFIGHPANLHAADVQCVRLNINSQPVLSHTYNPSTQIMTSLSLDNDAGLTWIETSLGGASSAISFQSAEDMYDTLRFFDAETQESHDASTDDSYFDAESYGAVQAVGWSPDEQFYALAVYGDTSPSYLTIFAKDGHIVASAPYKMYVGHSYWVWSPQSDRIAIVQPEEYQQDDNFTYLSLLSLTGTLVRAKIHAPLDPLYGGAALWSPDGRSIAITDEAGLRVVDSATGESVTVAQSAWVVNPGIDLVWTADSEYLLYLIAPDWNEDGSLDVQRYSVTTRKSTVLMDHMAPVLSASVYVPVSKNPGYMVVRKDESEVAQFFLVSGMTGEERMLLEEAATDISLNASYLWSPKGTALLLAAETTLVLQPESTTIFKLPERSQILFQSVHWSDNEEWVGLVVDNQDGNYVPWIVNVKTGEGRPISHASLHPFVIPNDHGQALLVEEETSLSLSLVSEDDSRVVLTTFLSGVPMEMYEDIAARWSPDGLKVAFIEYSPEDYSSSIHVVQSDGTLISTQMLPSGLEPVRSIEWVACP